MLALQLSRRKWWMYSIHDTFVSVQVVSHKFRILQFLTNFLCTRIIFKSKTWKLQPSNSVWKQLEVPLTGWQSSCIVALCANISCSTNQQFSFFNAGTFSRNNACHGKTRMTVQLEKKHTPSKIKNIANLVKNNRNYTSSHHHYFLGVWNIYRNSMNTNCDK
jgi:hypothetical protein